MIVSYRKRFIIVLKKHSLNTKPFISCVVNYFLFVIILNFSLEKPLYRLNSMMNISHNTYIISLFCSQRTSWICSAVKFADSISIVTPNNPQIFNKLIFTAVKLFQVKIKLITQTLKLLPKHLKTHFGLEDISSVDTIQTVDSYYNILILTLEVFFNQINGLNWLRNLNY